MRSLSLHPVFGPGEDRNANYVSPAAGVSLALHPVFGPGEDRNKRLPPQAPEWLGAAPSLRTG